MATAKRTPKKEPTTLAQKLAIIDEAISRPSDYTNHIIIHGDPHWKQSPIYRNGLVQLTTWMAERYLGATFISTGDQTDTSGPDWDTFALMAESLKRFAACSSEGKTYYLDGNHTQSRPKGSMSEGIKLLDGVVTAAHKPTEMTIVGKRVLFLPHLDWDYASMRAYDELEGEYDLVVLHATPGWAVPSMADAVYLPKIKCPLIAYGHIHYHKMFVNASMSRTEVIVPVPQPTRLGEEHENFKPQVLVLAPDGKFWMEDLPVFMTIERVRYDEEPKSKDNLLVIYDAPSEASAFKRYSFKDGYTIHEDAIEVLVITEEDMEYEKFETVSRQDVVAKLRSFAGTSDELTAEEKLMAEMLLQQAQTVRAQQQAAEVA